MANFTAVYNFEDKKIACAKLRNSILIFAAIAVAYAAFCTAFVLLYVFVNAPLVLCFILNFVATVAFLWFTVIFFSVHFAVKLKDKRFYSSLENAQFSIIRGTFSECSSLDGTDEKYASLLFDCAEGSRYLRFRSDAKTPFKDGVCYDLKIIGDAITEYKEADNVEL